MRTAVREIQPSNSRVKAAILMEVLSWGSTKRSRIVMLVVPCAKV
jgi:hypothetical protein